MKKDGEWIAALSTELEVSRVDVVASPMLDLIEVRTVPRRGDARPRIELYDQVEAAALIEALSRALDRLHLEACTAATQRISSELNRRDLANR